MKYQSVPVTEDLIETTNKTDSSDNKIRINHFDIKKSIIRDNHSNTNKYDSQTPNNNKDNSEDKSHDKLNSSQHQEHLKSNEIVDHENQSILTKEPYNSTSVSVTELTNIDISLPNLFLQCLYKIQDLSLQYLHEAVITNLCIPCLYKKNIYGCTPIIIATSVSTNVST